MAVIDFEALDMDVVHASRADLYAAIDEEAHAILGISGQDLLDQLRAGAELEEPAAIGLVVLARAFIASE